MHPSSQPSQPKTTQLQQLTDWIVLPEGFKEEFLSFRTYGELNEYRQSLEARFGDDRLKAFNVRADTENAEKPPAGERHSWAMYYESDSGSQLFFYREIHPSMYRPHEYVNYSRIRQQHMGFREWLIAFNPRNWNDLLMVRNCYFDHVLTGRIMDWEELNAMGNMRVNARLRQSRGLLLWNHQLQALLSDAMSVMLDDTDGVNQSDCSRVMRGYLMKEQYQKSRQYVESLHVEGIPFAEILDRRWLIRSGSANRLGRSNVDAELKSLEMADFLWRSRTND